MPALRGGEIGCCAMPTQGGICERAKPAGQSPAGRATRVVSGLVLVVADVHPDVAPAERRHGRLPHIALVIRVVARLIDIRKGDAEDRGMEAMVPPDKPLAASVVA